MLFQQLASVVLAGLAAESLAKPMPAAHNELPGPAKRALPLTHVLHERAMPHWERTWEAKERMSATTQLPMRIGLKQQNLEEGHDVLMEISDPTSEKFGKHMTADEVRDMFAPSIDQVKSVVEWLTSSGIDIDRISQSANKQWIQFDASVAEAEDLLFTEYYVFEHAQSGSKDFASKEYHVPRDVADHIDYITPGIRVRKSAAKVKEMGKRATDELEKRGFESHIALEAVIGALPPLNSTNCDKFTTHECIRAQYGIPKGTKASPGNELGVFESLGDHYGKEDLDVFLAQFFPEIPQGTYPKDQLIDGAFGATRNASAAGAESNLDFEAAIPLIWPQTSILFQTDDENIELNQTDPNTPFLGFWNTFFDAIDGSYCKKSAYGEKGNCVKPECLDPIYPDTADSPDAYKGQLQCGVYKPTNVISISYGGGEGDVPAYYWKRQCDEIMKLSLQGVTVVISSGDDGVASYEGDNHFENGCAGDDGTIFWPSSEATCPYALAVGSTQFVKDTAPTYGGKPKYNEVSTSRFASGGGFSNYFKTPKYQAHAVKKYFDEVTLNFTGYRDASDGLANVGNGVFHIGGRGYPDVAALGDNFIIRSSGLWRTIGGTSLSAPLWASMLTLINEERLAIGKPTLGFVNPTLYQHPEVFTDVTEGSNPGCNSGGFQSAKGWDPVSGLGSPIFPKLLKLLKHA